MIFESLHESSRRGELILIAGGYCRWHRRRRDDQITIYEIISQRRGAGSEMLTLLRAYGLPIVAKCPADLESNRWYARRGFALAGTESTRSGRVLNVWRLAPC